MDKNLVKALTEAVGIGHLKGATDIAKAELLKYAKVKDFGSIGLIAEINQNKDKTVMLEAHIDEVGFIVTHVFDDGFIKLAKVGGNDQRILPATQITIHGKEEISAVFVSTPPHLAKGGEAPSLDDTYADTGLKNVADLIKPGDFATYKKEFSCLYGNKVTAKSLDDRAAVACLIEVAKRLCGKELPVNVIFCLSEQEELGTRGAITAAYSVNADEAVAVDVSFGDCPDLSPTKSGTLGGGAMIGISPVLNRKISGKLTLIVKENNIPHQFEVMGGATGTDADVISVSKGGIPCGLVSIPLRNMHTPAEVVDLTDLDSVCDILEAYILTGGAI